ncbi:MAG: CcoQ/FixQ family Cbb3-type cytochrome c oxidase assembly chaperone [Planctomycetota bacterium]|nr:CcoQ/FixQ family Cbb3-type cytochrome c oxidase assembly chaperone [Planctomycetota bacterium]
MSMTDIVSAMNSTLGTQIGLVLFVSVFLVVVVRMFRRGNSVAHRRFASLPLSEARVVSTGAAQKGASNGGT